jgi:hypothetical protein
MQCDEASRIDVRVVISYRKVTYRLLHSVQTSSGFTEAPSQWLPEGIPLVIRRRGVKLNSNFPLLETLRMHSQTSHFARHCS